MYNKRSILILAFTDISHITLIRKMRLFDWLIQYHETILGHFHWVFVRSLMTLKDKKKNNVHFFKFIHVAYSIRYKNHIFICKSYLFSNLITFWSEIKKKKKEKRLMSRGILYLAKRECLLFVYVNEILRVPRNLRWPKRT